MYFVRRSNLLYRRRGFINRLGFLRVEADAQIVIDGGGVRHVHTLRLLDRIVKGERAQIRAFWA